jgi:hypothetical protein
MRPSSGTTVRSTVKVTLTVEYKIKVGGPQLRELFLEQLTEEIEALDLYVNETQYEIIEARIW